MTQKLKYVLISVAFVLFGAVALLPAPKASANCTGYNPKGTGDQCGSGNGCVQRGASIMCPDSAAGTGSGSGGSTGSGSGTTGSGSTGTGTTGSDSGTGSGNGTGVTTSPAPASTPGTFQNDACAGVQQIDSSAKCDGSSGSTIDKIIKWVVAIFTAVVGFAAVLMIIVAGFKFVTANGDSSAVASARSTVIYAVIGLVLVILAQVIVRFVIGKSTT